MVWYVTWYFHTLSLVNYGFIYNSLEFARRLLRHGIFYYTLVAIEPLPLPHLP